MSKDKVQVHCSVGLGKTEARLLRQTAGTIGKTAY